VTAVLRKSQLLREPPVFRRQTYFVQTWGCQMNEEDSEQIALYLEQIGFSPASSIAEAEVVLLNTCSVRKKPEDKAFSLLGQLEILKASRPELVVGVCGCMAQVRAKEIHRRSPQVDFVVGTGQIAEIPALVQEAITHRRFETRLDLPERKGSIVDSVPQRHVGRHTKLKAYVPIQYGCDKFCSFCIVPTTRGRERSRPTVDILDEIKALADNGTKEVTLLGQTVNSYGKNLPEGRVPFSELLWKVAEIPGVERIRFTSPYPKDFTEDLIATIRDCPQVMEHCHLPLQSGDDEMLRSMKRLYTTESFLEIIGQLREAIPRVALTTDLIVGFPGETEAQFENSVRMMETIQFDSAYMFIYSPRPGTPAADMEQLPYAIKQERLARLNALQNTIGLEKNRPWVGQTAEVLVEGPAKVPGLLFGYSRECKMVHFAGSPERTGRLARVAVKEAHLWGLSGELTSNP
jgi:tRNA-2-methylthio-N6-dimethylallyladenosine synthase